MFETNLPFYTLQVKAILACGSVISKFFLLITLALQNAQIYLQPAQEAYLHLAKIAAALLPNPYTALEFP